MARCDLDEFFSIGVACRALEESVAHAFPANNGSHAACPFNLYVALHGALHGAVFAVDHGHAGVGTPDASANVTTAHASQPCGEPIPRQDWFSRSHEIGSVGKV